VQETALLAAALCPPGKALTLAGCGSTLALCLPNSRPIRAGVRCQSKEPAVPVVEESVVIARPPQEVFDFLSKFENIAVYDSSVTSSGQVGDGPVGLGSRGRGTSKIMGRQFDWTVEVTEFDPPRRMVSRSVEGKLDFTVTLMLEPAADGTRLTQRIDAASGLGGVFGKLADALVERAQGRTVRANLETLAEWMAEHPQV
jgi:carbon monoxide dehydrogenase subunit G